MCKIIIYICYSIHKNIFFQSVMNYETSWRLAILWQNLDKS